MTEDQLQAECFKLTWNYFPELRRKFWHVPNGGSRDAITAKKLQAAGVIPGVWDIHFFVKGRFIIVEMKVGNNLLSQPQRVWRELMQGEGASDYVCYCVEDWKMVVWHVILLRGEGEAGYDEWMNYKG